MSNSVIITAMICVTVIIVFWMSISTGTSDGGDEE